jgi:hypothetical protein
LNPRDGNTATATRSGWIPLLSLLAGLALVATGLALVVGYVRATFADLSLLFWGLVLPGIGVPLLALGIGMLLLAYHARRSQAARRFAKRALWILAIAGCGLALAGQLRWRQNQAAFATSSHQAQLDTVRASDARRLQPLAVTIRPDALLVQAQPGPGLDGQYRWTLQVNDERAILFTASRTFELHGAAAAISQRIEYSTLFRGCFDPAPPQSYACVAHAGSDNLLVVRGRLDLIADSNGTVTGSGPHIGPPGTITAQAVRVETFNDGNAIREGRVQLVQR